MSLNGLDDPVVTSAYQGALAEGGGWFLLHYVSRDAVNVLARGTGGAAEARAAVANYNELSPLYGFLLYRRRKVLIKYTPEGTSRLLQARTAVHFTSVAEKFTPHDITMTIQSAEELSDSALASACSLHTAATSTCSSSSSRKKLSEITEDAEEGIAGGSGAAALGRPPTATSVQAAISEGPPVELSAPLETDKEMQSLDKQGARNPMPFANQPPELSSSGPEPHVSRAAEIRQSLHSYEELFKDGPDPRLSSQTARPAASDLYAEIYAQYNKPKVKLGPRPKVSLDGKRPHTSGTGAHRPVSSLPAGMRAANRRTMMEVSRPKSRESSAVPSIAVPPPPPLPAFPSLPTSNPDSLVQLPLTAPKSPASVRSMTLPSHNLSSRNANVVSPEKQRLMKALELRKKRQQQRQEGADEVTKKPRIDKEAETVTEAPKQESPTEGDDEITKESPKTSQEAEAITGNMRDANGTKDSETVSPIAADGEPPVPPVPGMKPGSSVEDEVNDIVSRHNASGPNSPPEPEPSPESIPPPILSEVHADVKPEALRNEKAQKRVASSTSVNSVTPVKSQDTVGIPSAELAEEFNSVIENSEKPEEAEPTENHQPSRGYKSEGSTLPSRGHVASTRESEEKTPCGDGQPSKDPSEADTVPVASEEPVPTPEGEDLPSASSPVTAQTQTSSAPPSTRPSSLSDDEPHPSKQTPTFANEDRQTLQQLELSVKSEIIKEEQESTESTPTVVPDTADSTPAVEVESDPDSQSAPLVQLSPPEDTPADQVKAEPSPPTDDATSSQPQSKRASMLFSSNAPLQGGETLSKRQKRESMVLSVPKRRSRVLDSVQINLNGDNRDSQDYLSDDSFMDELQSATVQEAKPMSVSKSPITPFFPRKPSSPELDKSSPSAAPKVARLTPEQSGSRKLSGVWPPPQTVENVPVPKKINVSSGISQRIKALAEKSNKDSSSSSVSPLATPDASASIVAQRKSSFFAAPVTGDSSSGKVVNRLSIASFANLSSTAVSDRASVLQSPSMSRENSPAIYNVRPTTEKPESVQVTARIVRDGRPLNPSLSMPTESTPLELHRSEITIDHQKSTRTKTPVSNPPTEPTSPKAPSSSHSKDQVPILPRSSSESSWRSFGRRLSESKSASTPRSLSAHSSESEGGKREDKKEKKDSRTSKLFKRMSSFPSITRKGQSGSLQEDEHTSRPLASLREPPPPVQVGDLNVQFPDTLLWKRRWVEIDAAGNLVLSVSKPNEQMKGITKRFHLTEFRTPYAPDQDQQELPNSVVFDFIDGRTLQCACETVAAQMTVLQVFREAHDAWIAYDQGS
ncbi:uncharacterized protein EI97DRAFT_461402 [Westerdykella ornata]|uniref:ADF-H domain-containing protein n=1 Tax=Westerdykella ornata TaxID=318751 RepID=A0A6A6JAG2_WESOR|nr:uncharacterized protein EI97DRAFT_461402 [Westerdykella ornata]KAF2273153.1 hypothetical protein EI97DRAFT_461402 [Westerdykella ornata]